MLTLTASQLLAQTFTPKTINVHSKCGGFYEYLPAGYSSTTKKYPIIIYFHGGASFGGGTASDLTKLTSFEGTPRYIKEGSFPSTFTLPNGETTSYIVFSPQFKSQPSGAELNQIIDYALQNYRVDMGRVYLTGYSMGGGGTWFTPLNSAAATRLAAIAPVAGYMSPYNDATAQFIAAANLPAWAIHSSSDGTVPVSNSVNMVNKINSFNPPTRAIITQISGVSHDNTVLVAFDPAFRPNGKSIYEWFLQYARNYAPVANAGAQQTITLPDASVTLQGSGTDQDGTVTSYAWTQVSGTSATITNASSATTTITGLTTMGDRVFRLTVTDNLGSTGVSEVLVRVNNAVGNNLPLVNAGADQVIVQPTSSVTLNATASDNDGSIVNYSWTQLSGIAATISNPSSLVTSINGMAAVGARVFRLTVTDNRGGVSSDEVTVTLNKGNAAPVANAGSAQTINLPMSSVTLSGSGTDEDGTIAGYSWQQISGTAASIVSPSSATTTINGLSTVGVRIFQLTVKDNQNATATAEITITVNPTSTSQSRFVNVNLYANNDPYNNSQWNNQLIIQPSYPYTSSPYKYSDGSNSNIFSVISDSQTPFNSTFADNGANYPTTMCPSSVGRYGSYLANPRTVTFKGLDNSKKYDIQLFCSRSSSQGTTRNTINGTSINIAVTANYNNAATFTSVSPANGQIVLTQTPLNTYVYLNGFTIVEKSIGSVANAGSPQSITLPTSSVILNGSGTSSGTITSYAWSQLSGTSATIENPSNATTTISGLTSTGDRVFRLTVTDNQQLTAISEVTVSVAGAPNQVPVVNAGNPQTITLPLSTITLSGSATDGDGTISSTQWTQVSGTAASITNPGSLSTTITGLTTAGTRIFRLTATDNNGGLSGSEITVTVNAAIQYNIPVVVTTTTNNNNIAASLNSSVSSSLPITSIKWTKFAVPNQVAKSIAVVGSSTSVGQGTSVADSAYLSRVNKYYKAEGLLDTIYNLAASGANVSNVNITQALNKGAGILLVNYPSNTYTPSTNPITLAKFQEIKDSCDKRGVKFFCTGTQPRDDFNPADRSNLLLLNDSLRNRFGTAFIDFLTPVLNNGDNKIKAEYSAGDGIHINDAGHERFFQLIKAANLFESTSGSNAVILSPNQSATEVSSLSAGRHKFQVAVKAQNGLAATAVATIDIISVPNSAPKANAGSDKQMELPVNEITLSGTASTDDHSIISYKWKQLTGDNVNIVSPNNVTTLVNGFTPGQYSFELMVTDDSSATGKDTVLISVLAANILPTAIAGDDQSIKLPVNSVTLTGSATDSDGTIISYQWTKLSGDLAMIESPANATTTISGMNTSGARVFRLRVKDNRGGEATSDVTIVVNEGNKPPVANAGTAQTIQLPVNTVTLNGTAIDPDGIIEAYTWTQVSGNAATINTPGNSSTSVTMSGAGERVFRLTVQDNEGATAMATVTILVKPTNVNPVANAGSNQSITLPTSTVTLNGSGTDSDGTISNYSWTQIAGTSASITNPGNASTTVTGLTSTGERTFRLTVTDNQGATHAATVLVTVNPAPTTTTKVINVNMYANNDPYNNAQWNNQLITQASYPYTSGAYKYSDGTASTVFTTITDSQTPFGSTFGDNGAGYNTTMCPSAVGRYSTYLSNPRDIIFKGLNDSKTYTIQLYCTRSTNQGTTRNTLGSTVIDIAVTGNSANAATFNNVKSSGGQVTIRQRPLQTFVYLNGFTITETSNNQAMTSRTMTSSIVAATDVSAIEPIGLYPNPSADQVQLTINNNKRGKLNIVITDEYGKTIKQYEYVKDVDLFTKKLLMQGVAPGVYFLKLTVGDAIETRKLLRL